MDGSFVILQSERSQFRTRGPEIRVKNASNPQTFLDLDEHRGVFDIDCLPGWRLGDVQAGGPEVAEGFEVWVPLAVGRAGPFSVSS
jgi:hypothetical protein